MTTIQKETERFGILYRRRRRFQLLVILIGLSEASCIDCQTHHSESTAVTQSGGVCDRNKTRKNNTYYKISSNCTYFKKTFSNAGGP